MMILISAEGLWGEVFESESFYVEMDWRCPEGWVTCDDIGIQVVEKGSGKKWAETGESMHSMSSDGETPGRFRGYLLWHDGFQYAIYVDGVIMVKDCEMRLILEESGVWD